MRGVVLVILMFLLVTGVVNAQETATPTPEPTATPAPVVAQYDEIDGQPVAIEYTVTAGDVMIAILLLLLLFSLWGIGFLMVTGDKK